MITVLLIILGILVITITYLYFRKKAIFDQYMRLIEIIAVIFSVFFVLIQFQSSTDDFNDLIGRLEQIVGSANESKDALKSVDESLSNLPDQIDSFSSSIKSLNIIISSQKEQLKTTLTGFNESIYAFKSSVDSMVSRFNRKPNVEISLDVTDTDTSFSINAIELENQGELIAELFRLTCHFPNEGLSIIEFKNLKKNLTGNAISFYQINFLPSEPLIPAFGRPLRIECKVIINKKFSHRIYFSAYYTSPYGNDHYAELDYRY